MNEQFHHLSISDLIKKPCSNTATPHYPNWALLTSSTQVQFCFCRNILHGFPMRSKTSESTNHQAQSRGDRPSLLGSKPSPRPISRIVDLSINPSKSGCVYCYVDPSLIRSLSFDLFRGHIRGQRMQNCDLRWEASQRILQPNVAEAT